MTLSDLRWAVISMVLFRIFCEFYREQMFSVKSRFHIENFKVLDLGERIIFWRFDIGIDVNYQEMH